MAKSNTNVYTVTVALAGAEIPLNGGGITGSPCRLSGVTTTATNNS